MKTLYLLILPVTVLFNINMAAGQSGYTNIDDFCTDADSYYSLEEALEKPGEVMKLDIAQQKITSLSPDIALLTNLECLDLSFNRITDLPTNFSDLENLRYLNLAGTRYLSRIPYVLAELPSLEVLDLSDHPEWTDQVDEARELLPGVTVISDF